MSQNKEVSVTCCTDGTTKSLYSDDLSIFNDGSISNCRVTEVEFDNESQEWAATLIKTGQEIARGKNRQHVLEVESIIVNDLIFLGKNITP